MGDRGNIVVKQHGTNGYIYLYAHWGGYGMPQTLQQALARRLRWTDESYLARIIFDQMTEGDHGAETGFGITTYLTDHEYDLLVVDVAAQRVLRVKEPTWDPHSEPDFATPTAQWSFDEYVALDLSDGWDALDRSSASETVQP